MLPHSLRYKHSLKPDSWALAFSVHSFMSKSQGQCSVIWLKQFSIPGAQWHGSMRLQGLKRWCHFILYTLTCLILSYSSHKNRVASLLWILGYTELKKIKRMLHHNQKMFPRGFHEGMLYNCNYQEAPRDLNNPFGNSWKKMVLFNKSIPGTLVSKVFTIDITGDHRTFPCKTWTSQW